MNFDWDDLRLFLAVARGGGLAKAATETGKSAPTLARRMLDFERHMGRELFRRHARGYDLTEEGRALLNDLAGVEAAISPVVDTGRSARPVVKVSAGAWTTLHLCRNAERIVSDDSVAVRFIAANHDMDIRHRDVVIGIRNRRPEAIGLAGRRLGRVGFAVYAQSAGVARWARLMGGTPSAQWAMDATCGQAAIEVTEARNLLDLIESGAARAVLPTFVGDAIWGISRVSAEIDELAHDRWLVSHDEERFEPAVRLVLKRIGDLLAAPG